MAAAARGQPPHRHLPRVWGLQHVQTLPLSHRAAGSASRRARLPPDPHPALRPAHANPQAELPGQAAIQEAREKSARGQVHLWLN